MVHDGKMHDCMLYNGLFTLRPRLQHEKQNIQNIYNDFLIQKFDDLQFLFQKVRSIFSLHFFYRWKSSTCIQCKPLLCDSFINSICPSESIKMNRTITSSVSLLTAAKQIWTDCFEILQMWQLAKLRCLKLLCIRLYNAGLRTVKVSNRLKILHSVKTALSMSGITHINSHLYYFMPF